MSVLVFLCGIVYFVPFLVTSLIKDKFFAASASFSQQFGQLRSNNIPLAVLIDNDKNWLE